MTACAAFSEYNIHALSHSSQFVLFLCVFFRFRVVDECFVDTSPTCPESATDGEAPEENKKSPYSLIVSCNSSYVINKVGYVSPKIKVQIKCMCVTVWWGGGGGGARTCVYVYINVYISTFQLMFYATHIKSSICITHSTLTHSFTI